MLTGRWLDLAAMLMIGDGALAAVAPRRHMLVWREGPESWEHFVDAFAQRPAMTRVLGLIEVAAGFWLAGRSVQGAPALGRSRVRSGRRETQRGWPLAERWREDR
jgi:hypothetical protein